MEAREGQQADPAARSIFDCSYHSLGISLPAMPILASYISAVLVFILSYFLSGWGVWHY